ncbi:M56 family metallopeptidase [Paractinoplanes atraurantiacus]|uniref:Zn-dependent protease with chaperone function n=1 Tax=Paractinoplanes atraurantiacus TaxID=1036182 RepID=A0A285IN88_9ACTN|nr:M56 family metallopeptidase [Actinoplanes atraurantiacus]SNY49197.1 Zn-dependent protease with chaperone function [Actinoplanes atraurantiacus]
MTALLLGALGLTLSLVVPGPLARAHWPDRAPAAAVLLWQSITLSAVLSALGVVLSAPYEVTRAAGSGKPVAAAALIGALVVAGVIILRLVVSLIGVTRRSRVRRARHRELVDLLDRAEQHRELGPDNLRVLDGALPLAYCVPGREPRVVLSNGVLQVLDRDQVDAVLAHEQTHLRHRHEVVMESFTAFYRAVPGPLRSRAPLDAVHLLLEMISDDVARRKAGAEPLRAALERLSDAVPLAEDARADPTGDARRRRLDRLTKPHTVSVGLNVAAALAAVGLLVLPTVILVVPWLDRALDHWPL